MRKNNLQNTYFLAKNMSERKVARSACKQWCIVRPSIVGSVAYAPFPGWANCCCCVWCFIAAPSIAQVLTISIVVQVHRKHKRLHLAHPWSRCRCAKYASTCRVPDQLG